MAPDRSALLETAHSFIDHYNKWTVEDVMFVRSPTCIHHTRPFNFKAPSRNNDEFAAFLQLLIPVFRNFRLRLVDDNSVMVDVEKRKVLLELQSSADTDFGPYENEYIFILQMSEDGKMVDEIVEFLDTQTSAYFTKKFEEHVTEKAISK